METTDLATGKPLPADAIQRVLFIAPSVHVYNIPPLTSTKGYVAASWTSSPSRHIFTARLRILETAIPSPLNPASPSAADEESVKTDVLLEDPSTGQLFAAAPYASASAVEQVLDSSRFFAIRVQDERGRKAVLGIGFEERGEAFDFSVALQEVRKTLGLESKPVGGAGKKGEREKEEKRDFSLKEGETITVNIGARSKGRRGGEKGTGAGGGDGGAFSLPPPPYTGVLPPPPSAQEVKKKRLSQTVVVPEPVSMEDLGFDDGEFGEFQ
jgi:hypothetical protein